MINSELKDILSLKRPHGGMGEEALAKYVVEQTGGKKHTWGVKAVSGDNPRIALVAHLDTVHHSDGANNVVCEDNTARISRKSQDCLGADDGAGVYALLQLYRLGVPAVYLFFVGEECGGIGAHAIPPEELAGIDIAIEFDRKGFGELITNCGSSRFFQDQLCSVLGFRRETGIFTDVHILSAVIPECVNLSVGYEHAHTKNETLNVAYLEWLIGHVFENWPKIEKLPAIRKSEEQPEEDFYYPYHSSRSFQSFDTPRQPEKPLRRETKDTPKYPYQCDICTKPECSENCQWFQQAMLSMGGCP